MNIKLLATALVVMNTIALTGCSSDSSARIEEALTGKPALVPVEPVPLLDVPDPIPEPEPVVEEPTPVAEVTAPPPPVVVPEPEPAVPAEPECVTIWRVQTCEEGVLHMLDSNGNWIN